MPKVIIVSFIGCGALRLLKGAVSAAWFALVLTGCALRPPSMPAAAPPAVVHGSAPPSSAPAAAGPAAIMVASATAMLGQPYRYGGSAPGGFDCSGLVAYAALRAGIRLPRTAHQQLRAGRRIRRSDLRAGDLVFMHLAGKELHVGIALDGARFIHAPASGGRVRIDSLAAAPYARGFIGARRVIDAGAGAL
ncbi:MAG TPA: C40 family peptidase [Steroidobacteraceae bacterium]|nr:C40 family peptidase [Steroidobacteraceae bacterium]